MSIPLLLMCAAACSSMLLVSSRKMTIADREALIDSIFREVEQDLAAMKQSNARDGSHDTKEEAKVTAHSSLEFAELVEKKLSRKPTDVRAKLTAAEAPGAGKPSSMLAKQDIDISTTCADHPDPPDCSSPEVSHRRTADGTCNNLDNPQWGAAMTPFNRLLPANYDDGFSLPRGYRQSQGSNAFSPPVPSARVVSLKIMVDEPITDPWYSNILMQFGQFLETDMVTIATHEDTCLDNCTTSLEIADSCFPILLPEDDSHDIKCYKFQRTISTVCATREREQINMNSHFIDASMLYGTTDMLMNELRDLDSNGLLRTGPPVVNSSKYQLPSDPYNRELFFAGDHRINLQAGLTVMHTLWLREHNRIAQIIGHNNPTFTSDEVFFTTRDIVIAEIQKIVYEDYLPILLRDNIILPYSGYDSTVHPNIPNSFAAAAFRFGHSQVPPFLERLDENFEPITEGSLPLGEAFFDTTEVREFGTDRILRGLLSSRVLKTDEFISGVLTNNLFAANTASGGQDLAARDIQRGRDHGLPSYGHWKLWADRVIRLEDIFQSTVTLFRLMATYGSLDDADLYVGGLAEKPLPGGILGPVFGAIIGRTFADLRNGDRFFYKGDTLFDDTQKAEIDKASLSRVICDNSEITEVQENAFLVGYDRVPCSQIPSMDLDAWAAEPAPSREAEVQSSDEGRLIHLIAEVYQLRAAFRRIIRELQ